MSSAQVALHNAIATGGIVYILENARAQRVKVGVTTTGVALRLKDVNDIWSGVRVTCQLCGNRVLHRGLKIRQHKAESRNCPGGNQLPIERGVALAQAHLRALERRAQGLSGSELGSITRKINKLKRRVERYRHYEPPEGDWSIHTTFSTQSAERVEKLTHQRLADHLDDDAPFGEVFRCSPSEAIAAVEAVLNEIGQLESARRGRRSPHR